MVTDPWNTGVDPWWLIINDAAYFVQHELDIWSWCQQMDIGISLEGVMMKFDTESDRMLFVMAWA
jgi:hypothetical protein